MIIADDLYVGADDTATLLSIWEDLLSTLSKNGLVLSGSKTVITPLTTTVLGWIWNNGSLCVSQHKICPLRQADPPKTCTAMRSFLGAYKNIARAIPRSSSFLSPLESAIAGLNGKDLVVWNEDLKFQFKKAKYALDSAKSLFIPSPTDKLVVTVDASPLNNGLGATLFVMVNKDKKAADFFSFKLKPHQVSWLPCEKEALAINAAAAHFACFIRESEHTTQILTDNKPCVQAWEKLRNGMFSASARVSSFLSTLSSLNVVLCHIKGTLNRISDYSSRHPVTCDHGACQICKFVQETVDSVVRSVDVEEVMSGKMRMPFTNYVAWKSAQRSNSSMRKAFAHLQAGTRPSKKTKDSKELKDILRLASVDESKGILIVRKQDPYIGNRDLIFCPSDMAHGLILAIHIHFKHPSKSQTEKLFSRNFYALRSSSIIDSVCDNCEACNALKKIPTELFNQTSSPSPKRPGMKLAADVICRKRQKILVVRDCLTSFTTATFLLNETAEELKNGILLCCLPLQFNQSEVRVDCATGLKKLAVNSSLKEYGITLDVGHAKNVNKNPVAERANQELELELLKVDPSGNPVTAVVLLQAVCSLNTRIRANGLSSKEMFTRRDQTSGDHLKFSDSHIAEKQQSTRSKNHAYSSKSKARGSNLAPGCKTKVGKLVYLKDEGSKFKPRDTYMVVDIKGQDLLLQKMAKTGLYASKQYLVPNNKVFPVLGSSEKEKAVAAPDSSSESDCDYTTASNSSDSYSSDASDASSETTVEDHISSNDNVASSSSRPARNRRKPEFYGSVANTGSLPPSVENDTIANWYPGWDKDRTRRYIENGQKES